MKQHNEYENLFISQHPVIVDKLSRLRDRNTSFDQFRTLLEQVTQFLFYEATGDLETTARQINTPLETTDAAYVKKEILLVPILRAGLGMVNGIVKIWKKSRVGVLGMYRDDHTLQPVDYYLHLPDNIAEMTVFLVDPMLATGGSAVSGIDTLKEHGAKQLSMITLLCAPDGIDAFRTSHPEIKIYSAALDRQLNEKGYILPGLGDAGDRYFGT